MYTYKQVHMYVLDSSLDNMSRKAALRSSSLEERERELRKRCCARVLAYEWRKSPLAMSCE